MTRTDPVVHHARKEALAVAALWIISMTWTVGFCYVDGYNRPPEELQFVAGMPRWVFWGVLVPWLGCAALSAWFAFYYMTDADLGADQESAEDALAHEGADHA